MQPATFKEVILGLNVSFYGKFPKTTSLQHILPLQTVPQNNLFVPFAVF